MPDRPIYRIETLSGTDQTPRPPTPTDYRPIIEALTVREWVILTHYRLAGEDRANRRALLMANSQN